LGHLQLAGLRSLWQRGSASVNDVHADLYDALKLAPTTVATVLRRMETRGLVNHTEEGRQFLYQPLISEGDVAESAAEEVLDHADRHGIVVISETEAVGLNLPLGLNRLTGLPDELYSDAAINERTQAARNNRGGLLFARLNAPGDCAFLATPPSWRGGGGHGSYFFFLAAFGFGSGVSACGSKPI